MPSLSAYKSDLDYSYATGAFPAVECLKHRGESVRRILLHSKAAGTDLEQMMLDYADQLSVRAEQADRVLRMVSGKDNCFAAVVFEKFQDALNPDLPHVVLHHPSDFGNLGTILRTALGFGIHDIALIRPCADPFDPKVVRGSMGSLFRMRLHLFDDFAAYQELYPDHAMYPFMLDASRPMEEVLACGIPDRYALIFGNEGSGLPKEFSEVGQPVRIDSSTEVDSLNLSIAAGIGIYRFTHAGRA